VFNSWLKRLEWVIKHGREYFNKEKKFNIYTLKLTEKRAGYGLINLPIAPIFGHDEAAYSVPRMLARLA
jgi:hypothetical protein